MISVKVGKRSFPWKPAGRTLEIIDNLMLQSHKGYDTIIVNEAHNYPNICLFAKLCKKENTNLLVGGLLNENTEGLLRIADSFELVCSSPGDL